MDQPAVYEDDAEVAAAAVYEDDAEAATVPDPAASYMEVGRAVYEGDAAVYEDDAEAATVPDPAASYMEVGRAVYEGDVAATSAQEEAAAEATAAEAAAAEDIKKKQEIVYDAVEEFITHINQSKTRKITKKQFNEFKEKAISLIQKTSVYNNNNKLQNTNSVSPLIVKIRNLPTPDNLYVEEEEEEEDASTASSPMNTSNIYAYIKDKSTNFKLLNDTDKPKALIEILNNIFTEPKVNLELPKDFKLIAEIIGGLKSNLDNLISQIIDMGYITDFNFQPKQEFKYAKEFQDDINANDAAMKAAAAAATEKTYKIPTTFKEAYDIYYNDATAEQILDFKLRIETNTGIVYNPDGIIGNLTINNIQIKDRKKKNATGGDIDDPYLRGHTQEDPTELLFLWDHMDYISKELLVSTISEQYCNEKNDLDIFRNINTWEESSNMDTQCSQTTEVDGNMSYFITYQPEVVFDEKYQLKGCITGSKTRARFVVDDNKLFIGILLKRFEKDFNTNKETKLTGKITLDEITLPTEDKSEVQYTPLCYIIHLGENRNSGHYVSMIKSNDNWYIANDSTITKFDNATAEEKKKIEGQAYFVIYVKTAEYNKVKIKLKEPKGIINNGNTCFFNALLQTIFHMKKTEELIEEQTAAVAAAAKAVYEDDAAVAQA
jgi:hypothetical protein